jgi:hypothetical protein
VPQYLRTEKYYIYPQTKILYSPVVNEGNWSEENILIEEKAEEKCEKLHNMCSSSNITPIRVMKSRRIWEGCVASMEEIRNRFKMLVEKPERKKRVGRPQCR